MRHIISASALAAACCLSLTGCSGNDDRSDPQPSPRTALTFGQSADTAGAGGKGTAQITPDAVVYVDKAGTERPEHGLFAVVRFEAENRSKTPVTTTARQGGFRWKASDGKTVKAGNSEGAGRIAPVGFSESGPDISPKTYQADSVVFDITAAEKGGTLVYVDGDDVAFRWKMPSTDSGSPASALKSALK
ncbi:hypothetical protein QF035_001554 [Streptomyces umbrinus]|uniref:DUF4352 domain-containing protein n=1 Tax=Streptomyces umbrinus TaxID=67370 RepID=A0ABU0SK86_9ACTN|nr:hypothetical protein [Streptomyces umbrinus]MDQ1023972.1 hypothetical protein [Streptomyces umbrinus]